MNHLSETDLHDLADGGQDADALQHVAVCADCRAELAALRSVLASLAALPRGIAPGRDLLAGIHARIDAQPASEPAQHLRARTLWSLRWPLAAAAVLLIVATAVVTRVWIARTEPSVASVPPAGTAQLVRHQPQLLQQKYESAITELEQLVAAQRAQLSPTTLRLLQENLRVIDRAIRESQAALQQDPNNQL